MGEYTQRSLTKVALKQRLIADGQWAKYVKWRSFYWSKEVPRDIAWKVAAYFVPPLDGSPPELVVDPMYAAIVAGIKNGKYPEPPEFEKFPNGATNFAVMQEAEPAAEEVVKKVKAAPKEWNNKWEELADKVGHRKSTEYEDLRWVVENYLTHISRLNPDEVPSKSALGILSWVQLSPSNYGDFLRTNYSKLIPDRKALEYQARFQDDGRKDLKLLEDFERSLLLEQEAEFAEPTETLEESTT